MGRHIRRNHPTSNIVMSTDVVNHDVYDVRLKENFKLFVSGPSRCGKTVFVSKLLENIYAFAKVPPTKVIYVYKVWQQKFEELLSLGVNFKKDYDNIVNDIKASISGEPILVIFDDLIGSSSLKDIADLFTVDARHMNISLVFLTQRMFVNDESFRQISQNCDYFVIFKNPRNSSEIRALAQQMTPGNLILVNIYMEATKWPFSYLFINLTQECEPKVKFLSNLFDDLHSYVPDGKSFRKISGKGNFKSLRLGDYVQKPTLETFKPPIISPNKNTGQQAYPYMYSPRQEAVIGEYNNNNLQPYVENYSISSNAQTPQHFKRETEPITKNPKDTQTDPVNMSTNYSNTETSDHKYIQTTPVRHSTKYSNTQTPGHMYTQTIPVKHSTKYTNTLTPYEKYTQTTPLNLSVKYTNTQTPDLASSETAPLLNFQSNFARQLAQSEDVHVDNQPQALTHNQLDAIAHTQVPAITHTQPRALAHTQPPALQYNLPTPLTFYQPPNVHNQQHPIEHQTTQPIEHMQVSEIQYNQPPPLTYHQQPNVQNQPHPIEHRTAQPIEPMQVGEIEYNQPPPLTHNTHETHSQLQPFGSTAAQNSSLKTITQPEDPAITYDKSLVIEYVCTLWKHLQNLVI